MAASDDPIGYRRTLYDLREVTLELEDRSQVGPISWLLLRGVRVRVRCAYEAQWEAFAALLSGQQAPASGAVEEVVPVTVQTDARLRATMSMNQSLDDYLHSGNLPELIWLEGRRHSLRVLVDVLGITTRMARHPLKFCNPETVDKAWALRFLLSRADLLIARDLLRVRDPDVRTALRRSWGDLPGTLVACESEPPEPLPGPAQGWVRIDAQGAFSAGDEPAAGPPGPDGGAPPRPD
jgi:hypothetical protein